MKDDIVKHSGFVKSINGNHLQVMILQTSSCSSCNIKSYCSSAESKEHSIDVFDKDAHQFHVGDEVWVIGSTNMSRLAVWYGYLLPLLLLMSFMFGLTAWWDSGSELSVALYSLGCVVIYYLLLYYFGRDKLRKTFRFSISKVN